MMDFSNNMYQYQFLSCNKCTQLMQDVNRGNCGRGGGEIYGNSLYFWLNFSGNPNPKIALTNKVYFKNKINYAH